jgi:hypothetical protein
MASLREVRQAYLAALDMLLKYENVIGVGFGPIERKGKLTLQPGIIALVTQKLPSNEVTKGQLIPKTFHGVSIDVREPSLTEEAYHAFLKRNGISPEQGECNRDHFFLNDLKIHQLNLDRLRRQEREEEPQDPPTAVGEIEEEPQDPPTAVGEIEEEPQDPSTAVSGEIFVIEDNGTIISGDTIDHVAAYDLFRTQFGDHYDFVFFHYDLASGVPGQGNASSTIHNMITGINHYKGDSYNDRATWNSTKIQLYQKVTGLTQIRRMLHETAHRWCAYVYHQENGTYSENLHKGLWLDTMHWGFWFDNDRSCMDYDKFDWRNSSTIPGKFEKDHIIYGPPGTDAFGYHPLDLYLMGLMSASEVGTFRYIENPVGPDGDGIFSGTEVNLTVANVVAEEGPRNPAYPNTQRIYHQAFILITNNLGGIGTLSNSSTVLGNFERYRAGFLNSFRSATHSRAMIDGSLLHNNFQSLYIRDNNADTGSASSIGEFINSPDIWVRNSNDVGTVHQDTIRGQNNYIYARIWNSSSTEYEDVTVRFYRANFTGTEFYYPEEWHPDQLIGEDTITVPSAGNAIAKVTWKSDFIPDATWHPCLLVEVIPMEVTPENRHHVWENRKLAQKNINIIDLPGGAPV